MMKLFTMLALSAAEENVDIIDDCLAHAKEKNNHCDNTDFQELCKGTCLGKLGDCWTHLKGQPNLCRNPHFQNLCMGACLTPSVSDSPCPVTRLSSNLGRRLGRGVCPGSIKDGMPCKKDVECESKKCSGNLGGLRTGKCAAKETPVAPAKHEEAVKKAQEEADEEPAKKAEEGSTKHEEAVKKAQEEADEEPAKKAEEGSNNHVASGNPDLFRGADGTKRYYDASPNPPRVGEQTLANACYGFWAYTCPQSEQSQSAPFGLPCPQDMATCPDWEKCPRAPYLKKHKKGEFVKKLSAIQAGVDYTSYPGVSLSRYRGETLPEGDARKITYHSNAPYENFSPNEGRHTDLWMETDALPASRYDVCWTGVYLEHYIQQHGHVPPEKFLKFVRDFELDLLPDRQKYYSDPERFYKHDKQEIN